MGAWEERPRKAPLSSLRLLAAVTDHNDATMSCMASEPHHDRSVPPGCLEQLGSSNTGFQTRILFPGDALGTH